VKYITSTVTKTITLFKEKDIVPSFYQVAKIGEDAIAFENRTRFVLYEPSTSKTYELVFPNKGSADEFWDWLLKFTTTKPNDQIVIDQYQLKLRSGGSDSPVSKNSLSAVKDNIQALPYYR
jgi:hypothetical protein